jgi:hypothetical protein
MEEEKHSVQEMLAVHACKCKSNKLGKQNGKNSETKQKKCFE